MRMSMKLKYDNHEAFYREAGRSVSTEEINESAGLRYLLSKEIEYLKNELAQELVKDAELSISKDYDGDYILELDSKGN